MAEGSALVVAVEIDLDAARRATNCLADDNRMETVNTQVLYLVLSDSYSSSVWGMVEGRKWQQVVVEREEGERDRGSNNKNNNPATLTTKLN